LTTYSGKIGLEDLYYSILTADTAAALTYSAPVKIVDDIQEAKITVDQTEIKSYGDNHLVETKTVINSIEVELTLRQMSLALQKILLGMDSASGIYTDASDDSPPEVALGFKQTKASGAAQYLWLCKGKFQVPNDETKGTGEKPEFQGVTLKGTFQPRTHDKAWRLRADEEDPSWIAAIGTNWFTADTLTGDTIAALTITCSPADEATGVTLASNITWTFNNAITVGDITAANFALIDDEGNPVAGTLTYDAAHEVVTLDPTSALTTSKKYVGFASGNVTDVYGQVIAAGNTWSQFTTE